MADSTLEVQGLHIRAHDLGANIFSFNTHDMAGGLGVADQGMEVQGYRLHMHDNGDGTFSLTTTATTGAGDVSIEHEGIHLKLHPTGTNDPITKQPMYALVVNAV